MKNLFVLISLLSGLVARPIFAQETTEPPTALPDQVTFEAAGLLPEGVEWDGRHERFVVGSLAQGTIHLVADDGTLTPFIEDEALIASVGLEVDEFNGRLLVAVGEASVFFNPAAQGLAGVAAYDLLTGERLFYTDLGALLPEGRHFANDLALDTLGNVYITDSFSPVIYIVDINGSADILVEDDRFGSDFIGLNGIEYVPGADGVIGFLLVGVTGSAALYKVPLEAPEEITPVELRDADGEVVTFAIDGMALLPDGRLAAVANYEERQEIVLIRSDDEFMTATLDARLETTDAATTLAIRDEQVYFINAYLGNPLQATYEIVRAVFEGRE